MRLSKKIKFWHLQIEGNTPQSKIKTTQQKK